MQIPLAHGLVTLVDESDMPLLSPHSWWLRNKGGGRAYVCADIGGKRVSMHRLILSAQPGQVVDHIDHDPLNNTRANLRLCAPSDNSGNARKTKKRNCRFPYKGVFQHNNGRYYAAIMRRGKRFFSKQSDTVEEAARAYDVLAILHFGEFAFLNFPEERSSAPLVCGFPSTEPTSLEVPATNEAESFLHSASSNMLRVPFNEWNYGGSK